MGINKYKEWRLKRLLRKNKNRCNMTSYYGSFNETPINIITRGKIYKDGYYFDNKRYLKICALVGFKPTIGILEWGELGKSFKTDVAEYHGTPGIYIPRSVISLSTKSSEECLDDTIFYPLYIDTKNYYYPIDY